MSRLLYYLVILPLAHLPLRVLYVLADLLYWTLYRTFGYRTKVVRNNLRTAFSDKTDAERRDIERKFYRHLCNVIVEAIREFRIPIPEMVSRVRCTNPEVLNRLAERGHAVLCAGHYGNWEMAAAGLAPQTDFEMFTPYTPLSDEFINKKMEVSRGRSTMRLVPKHEAKKLDLETPSDPPKLFVLGTDQCPARHQKPVFLTFLGVPDTPTQFGAEHYAKKYDLPVVYMDVQPQRRGWNLMTVHIITEQPRETPEGWITRAHTDFLEQQIYRAPEYWLWTHKRWKRNRADFSTK